MHIHADPSTNLLTISPEGAISAEDIAELKQAANDYINANDRVPNLLIHAKSFPGWEDFSAMTRHIQFVRNHQKMISKVAIVGDGVLLNLLPPLADVFVSARLRHFPEKALDRAKSWLTTHETAAGGFKLLGGFPNDVIALDVVGKISSEAYRDMLVPLVSEKLKRHDKLKTLVRIGPEFEGYTAGAVWDDARLGLGHLTTFAKVALVTDIDWLRHSTKFFGHLTPAQVLVFDIDDMSDAEAWIRT